MNLLLASALITSLSIPSLGIRGAEVVTCRSSSYADMNLCVNAHPIVKYPDYAVLAAHNVKGGKPGPFYALHLLKPGDRLRYGRKVYTVTGLDIVPESHTEVLNTGEGELRLQTCSLDPRKRLMVTFQRI